jgi:cytochrome c oxidase cbb3-type subunit 1
VWDQVTADIANAETAGEQVAADTAVRTSPIVHIYLAVAAVFLVVGTVVGAVVALQLVFPEIGSGSALTSYGRLLPVATTAFLYGWLTIGLLGAAHHIVARMAGVSLGGGLLPIVALVLIAGGVAAGTGAVWLGGNTGRPMLEIPLWAAAVVLAGLALAAFTITITAARGPTRFGPPTWYLVTASWWLVLSWIAGNVPGVSGFGGVIQTSFYRASITGLWFVAAGVGIAYYLIPRLVGADPAVPSRLATLGFWSLAIAWVGTGARDLVYGAGPDWFETLGIALSIALIVPVLAISTDLALALRGRWGAVTDRVTLRFVFAGAFMFLIVPVAGLLQALRTSSAVVQFTSWATANDHLVLSGAVTMWVFAITYHVLAGGGPVVRVTGATWHLRYSLVGLGLAVFAMWVGGLAAGFTWAAGANEAIPTSTGEGFFNTAVGQQPYLAARAVGITVFALAQVLFLFSAFRRTEQIAGDGVEPVVPEGIEVRFAGPERAMGWRRLRLGAVSLFAAAAVFVWLLPTLDPSNAEATILADASRTHPEGSALAEGRAIYLSEGCWYCHTQEVRAIVTDVGLGAVSVAGDYANESPVLRGAERVGPDLMHVGSRSGTDSYRFVFAHLQDPRVARSWSNMPSYTYLTERDLDVLAQYIVSLG